ncbi:MAG TPA: non-ribosomal peptide synthetase, partial [Lachnospiraceae bacterium]|nr:non-ribosomal peptide synthetase [Lachnospiraceae bacterium]
MLFNQVVEIDLHVLDSLKYLLIGGEKLSEKHVKIFKENNNHTNLINGYGPTENTTFTTTYLIPDQFERITIGTPIANTQVYIVDKNRKLCGINVPGELCTTGDGLALGYLNHEELTKKVFIQNPFGEGMMYCTGDLAKWLPDGTIEFLGRMDQQVKIRGFRIELAEIETVINKISGISDCAVIIKEDSMGDKRICAFIVKNDKNLEIPVKEYLKNILPEYMIPTYICEVEVLPLNQNGKLDVKALLEIPIDINNEYKEPVTDIEKSLVTIWGKVLQVSKIGVSDNFFEKGGHSLKAMKVINKIVEELGVRLELRDIFEYATIEELATYISNKNDVMEEIAVVKEEQREYYPMSSAQKRIFVVSQLDSTLTAYNMPQVYEVIGKLDIKRLQNAFHELTNRHEVCKTRFYMLDNEAVQEVDGNIECEFTYEVVEDFNVEDLLKRFVRPFEFVEGGLIRLKIVQYKEQYYLFLDVHHIISDGMSMSIIFKELSDLYSKKTLPKLNIQYKDYCIWLQQCNIEKQKRYWLKEFEGDIPIVELPYDYKRGEIQSFRGNILNRVIDSNTRQRLIEFSKKSQTTEFMIFTSAIMITLGKYCNQKDIIIGSPVYGRTNSEVENLVGVFVNTLALRGDTNGEKSYLDFLKEVKETALRAYENQEYQFDDLIDILEIKRDISRNPLFDVMFSYQNNDSVELNIDNVFMKPVEHKFESQKFDLTFYISDSESNEYDLSVGYCTDLFMEETIQKIMDSFLDVIQSILLDENQKIKEIDIIKAEERDKVLHQFNSQSMSCSDSCTICEMFMKQANLTPNAVVSVYKNTKITYAQLRDSAIQLANYLRNQGVQREDIIGIMMEQSNDILVGILGILFSGAAYLPTDPSYPKDRIEYMLQDSGAKILVTQEHLVGTIDYTGKIICINDELLRESKKIQIINQPSDLAYVIYTSGSTGKPKGVMIEHHNIVNLVNWHNREYEVTSDDCSTKYAGFGFDASVWEIFPYIVVGAQIHVIDSDLRMNIQGLNQYFEENNISISFLPTQICEQFITLPNKSLRTLLTGGDKLRKYVPTNYRLVNNYGPTENTVVSTNYWVNAENSNIPIGKPIDNVRAYVIDKYHSLVPIGICGELAVSGENLARGYIHNEELTKEKFVENPFEPGKKMYLTGDIVRWRKDGNIEYIGRLDNQVKIRGNRVEIGEIEQAALQHVEISECVAMIWEANSGDKRIVLY